MLDKVLIANRGEIAVRVQQTLHTMGIATVAVYADPDATAPHVAVADEAYPLHGHAAEETYLSIEKLVRVARDSGAQAVHPGYGFLSENPAFARACREAGLVFIGPTPENMEVMGDKLRSKEIARGAGVPVVPGSEVCDGVGPQARAFAEQVGYPLLVKAAAGGGGRGMRLVQTAQELPEALEAATREARAAFSDGRVFLERYIARPRHVEVQVLADAHGHVIHVLERECSVQRRHQKVLEESPSPALTSELRQRIGEAAVAVAREAGYLNAGTVEFLLDAEEGRFYFLEMNTRLQVEHPVTEAITGLDLVAWQVRIAAGEPLSLRQDDIAPLGHALEARIYAEDPYQGFLPSTGTLRHWRPPSGPGLRLDSGVAEGGEVSPYYDPMLAKLIAWAPDRATCRARMEEALRRFIVAGVVTNIPFLRRVVAHPAFRQGAYDTRFLEEHPELTRPPDDAEARRAAMALAAWSARRVGAAPSAATGEASSTDRTSPWRLAGPWRVL